MKRITSLGLIAFSLAACSYSKHESPRANGAENVLYFDGVRNADLGIVPTGFVRKIRVHYVPGGEYECSIGVKSETPRGNLTVQSGFGLGGGFSPDYCDDPPGEEPITLDSAQCDDGACSVTSQPEGESIWLEVSAEAARATRLRVTVRTNDGTLRSDSISLRFAPASHIALSGPRTVLPEFAMPLMPGIPIGRLTPSVVDADGHAMSVDPESIRRTIQGDALSEDHTLVAKVGRASIQWELPGIVSRTVDIEVVDPRDARELIVLPRVLRDESDSVDFDAWRAASAAEEPIHAIEIDARDTTSYFYPTRWVMADGRRALGVLGRVTSSQPDLLSVSTHDWAFSLYPTLRTAEAKLSFRGVSTETVLTELPVRIRKD